MDSQCSITLHHYSFSNRTHSGLFYPRERAATFLQCALEPFRPAGHSGPWSLPFPHSVHQCRSLIFYYITHRPICAFTSNMLPTITHYQLHGSSHRALGLRMTLDPIPTVDVRFPTSLTSDGSDAMYVLNPSIFVSFAVGD